MIFVGIDLTSAFAATPRAVDIATLDDNLCCGLSTAHWPALHVVTGRDPQRLRHMFGVAGDVWAIDGPQALAAPGQSMRTCERILGAQGKTPANLPQNPTGILGFVRSGIDLFDALLRSQPTLALAGFPSPMEQATLFEVYPGAEWTVLARRRLPKKITPAGRTDRRALLAGLGVTNLPVFPTADQNDALVGAYLAWCTRHLPHVVELEGNAPELSQGHLREGYILHAVGAVPLAHTEPGPAVERPVDIDHAIPTAQDEDEDDVLHLLLDDYGLVHGKCPENAWLEAGHDYACVTAGTPQVSFTLEHSATFSGGRGWKVVPTIKPLLTKLGLPTPPALSGSNRVSVRLARADPK